MPSCLAIRDLRRRIRRHLARRRIETGDLAALIALDPPAALRGLRAVSAPIYGHSATRWSVTGLVNALGRAISLRLPLTTERSMTGTQPLRRLWMRSIATACAARLLTEEEDGLLLPEEAYLYGLLHALPTWIDLLSQLPAQSPEQVSDTWIENWNLPAELAAAAGVGDADACDPSILDMLERAEQIAEHAGFSLDESRQAPTESQLNCSETMEPLVQRTRLAVESMLRQVGLDFTIPDFEFDESPGDENLPFLDTASETSFDDMTLTLLGCSGSINYRGIITALTAAAVRHGGYDRAYYAKWCACRGHLALRAKADLSSRRLESARLVPNQSETEALRIALSEQQPIHITANDGPGILAQLGADEMVLVPLNNDFKTPSFLLLDRWLSLEPIRLDQDKDKAQTLSLAGSLLIENLLLRKRRERAQKFASTDGLTHLLNRTMGTRVLEQQMARAERSGQPLSVLLCDLDHFKQLNDTLGHLLGDHALRITAEVMRQTVRRADSISRFGGEEFLVVLPDTAASAASVLAARLHIAIEELGRDHGLPLTISIGLATNRNGDTWETILQRADHALYASKDRGRNRFAIDPSDSQDPAEVLPAGRKP